MEEDNGKTLRQGTTEKSPKQVANDEESNRPLPGTAADRDIILVIDDEPTILRLIDRVLQSSGYRCMTAQSEDEAMTLFLSNEQNIGLVIVDRYLASADGLDLHQRMVRRAGRKIPAILISGDLTLEETREGLSPIAFLQKPFGANVLLDLVQAFINT